MAKLTIDDINILHEGKQAKRAVLEKYPSIAAFISENNFDLYESSVKQYFRCSKLRSEKFRFALVQALGKSYDELIVSEHDQLRYYVNEVSSHVLQYCTPEDMPLLETLRNLCIKEKLEIESAMMYRAVSVNYFYTGNTATAIEPMKVAVSIVEGYKSHANLYVKCYSELGLYYFYMVNYNKSLEVYENIERFIKGISNIYSIDNLTLFDYYYRYALLHSKRDAFIEAKNLLFTALKYAQEPIDKGYALMNIGVIYKNQGDYKLSRKYYEEAYLLMKDTPDIAVILNNIAELHRCRGEYREALYYINKALSQSDIPRQACLHCFDTYVQIKASMNDIGKALDELLNLLSVTKPIATYRHYIIDCINTLINFGNHDKNILLGLNDLILNFIGDAPYESAEYYQSLASCLVKVQQYLKKL